MKAQITVEDFPMLFIDMMAEDLKKYLNNYDVQVGENNSVYVTFETNDVVKAQCAVITIDKYSFGRGDDECKILHRTENPT